MDTTRLTDTIVPAQVLLSGREVRDILYGVVEVREGRSEQHCNCKKYAVFCKG
jgi:hypothetical protein